MAMRRRDFAARIWSKLVLHERSRALLAPGVGVLAAVSGGPDSVCLAHFLAALCRRKGLRLSLLHVHHGLRGKEADRDARFVQALGKSLGVPARVVRIPVKRAAAARRTGIEDAARRLRYAALIREARRLGVPLVATGHHLDDQAETVLLNLLRGTRLAALGGIAPSRPLARGLALVRPLLALTRAEVLAYLEVHGLGHRLDRSNLSDRHLRNWLRRDILPRLARRAPRVREHLAGIAEQVRALPAAAIGGAGSRRGAGRRAGARPRPGRRS